jgi:hypothetical protein
MEVDLVIEQPDRLTLVEAKAAQTPSISLFDGARRVQRLLSEASRDCEIVVAYGGDEIQRRSDARLLPWADLHRHRWGT